MVTIKKTIQAAAIPLAVTSFMFIQGCNKDEEVPATKTNLLIGDWELTESGDGDVTSDVYSYLFKFKSSGDWQFCYENETDPTENYCYYNGSWKWEDSNEKKIIINQSTNSDLDPWTLDVTVLNETQLEGSLTTTYEDGGSTDSYTQSVKFVKIK